MRVAAKLRRDEAGQALPLILAVMLAMLAAGMIVFWLGFATDSANTAQTAADAAALAAEKNVVEQLQQPWTFVGGQWVPPPVDWQAAQGAAQNYAADDGGKVIEFDHQAESWGVDDVTVVVSTLKGLPAQSPDASKNAIAAARASTDPLSQSSPPIPISNDASLANGPRFVPHGGQYGFFPNPGADFSQGNEPEIAGALDQFAIKHKLTLKGRLGYVKARSAADTSLHTCGAAASVDGLPAAVTAKQLGDVGVERLFPSRTGQPDEITLAGTKRSACTQGSSPTPPTPAQPTPVAGNSDVHLVDLNGGPQGSFVSFPLGGISPIAGPWVIPTPIVMCESGGRNLPPNSAGASGYYQIIPSTWSLFGGLQFAPQAYLATKAEQDLVAARIWNGGAGWANWDCAKIVQWRT
jgi:Transglycosylase-like domain/Putative Flp pilus-assembly TadE/G-like